MLSRLILATTLVPAALLQTGSSAVLEGRIYLDANENGRLDPGEPGVPNVLVGTGQSRVASDEQGRYRLECSDGRVLLWIGVPRDCQTVGRFWRWTEGAKGEDFGLVRRAQTKDFCFVQITDTHLGRDDLLREFAGHIGQLGAPIAFVVNTGDLLGGVDVVAPDKAQLQYDRYLGAASAFTVPLWNMPGNHEHVAINVAEADKNHPLYGKHLYRQLLGPTYYAWDWGEVHFVALDGTSLPYQEKLGEEQLAWLRADLACQPRDKPLVLFCHQSLPAMRDAQALVVALEGRRVLGAFCGHLHSTFTTELAGFPVYHTGALSGSWWNGPNPDGTPQGFRLVHVQGDRLKTAYSSREGNYPLSVATPLASAVQSGKIAMEVVLLDFGKPAEPTAQLAGQVIPLHLVSREELWSTWKGTADTTQVDDGDRLLRLSSQLGNEVSRSEMRYLIINGRRQPYQADAPATLKFQVRRITAPDEVLLDGRPLATIPADTPNEATLAFEIPPDRLAKVNRVTLRAAIKRGSDRDNFSVGPIWLEYKNRKIYDLRYPTFERHHIGDAPGSQYKSERDCYFCLP
jgi:hypothetical protein